MGPLEKKWEKPLRPNLHVRAIPLETPSLVCIARALHTHTPEKASEASHVSSLLGGREFCAEKQHLNRSYQAPGL